ncbi:MAG: hypothetical protein HZC17_00880 [Candidatus Omnitrophica bacterium]|nr:hypothetical protein [Candidatus Omnitrophota bacterium]
MKKMLIGGLLGGAVIFAWGMFSWMVLPFHMQTMNNFKDEAAVQTTIMLNVSKAGVYGIPGCPRHETASGEAQNVLKKKAMEQMAKGPVAYVIVSPNGIASFPVLMLRSLAIQIVGLLLVILLFSQTSISSYLGRVLFFTTFAAAASVVGIVPCWNWWGFPVVDTLLEAADLLIGYTLAGLLIARCSECCQTSGKKK